MIGTESGTAMAVPAVPVAPGLVKHYEAKSVHVAIGKQETVKEAQVCNESMKT